jgi:hypothetical protein
LLISGNLAVLLTWLKELQPQLTYPCHCSCRFWSRSLGFYPLWLHWHRMRTWLIHRHGPEHWLAGWPGYMNRSPALPDSNNRCRRSRRRWSRQLPGSWLPRWGCSSTVHGAERTVMCPQLPRRGFLLEALAKDSVIIIPQC